MANAFFDNYRNLLTGGGSHTNIDWDADTVKVILYDLDDGTPNLSTWQDLADVTAGGIVSTATLASITRPTTGTVDAADTTLATVTGDTCEELIIYKDSGVASTSPLACLFDTFTSGIPVTPNGGDITVTWNASGLWTF